MRKDKKLLFISLKKEAFSGDISKATISQWIKNTVKLAYESANSDLIKLNRVKAHDVRSLASSLAFRGGVPLDEIMVSCFGGRMGPSQISI